MEKINTDKKTLRKFGITMGIVFLLITVIVFLKHKHSIIPMLALSMIFFALAYSYAQILKPVYILWMKLGLLLSWVNTRLILCIIFYICITPLGLIMKLLGKNLLDLKIEKNKNSYWLKNEANKQGLYNYERQF